ncbi:MAG: hypothetical protein LBI58_04545, partial [Tannerellaceae bacterium]|nr:hypothetical protein [Tannerellaceae bacterium]
ILRPSSINTSGFRIDTSGLRIDSGGFGIDGFGFGIDPGGPGIGKTGFEGGEVAGGIGAVIGGYSYSTLPLRLRRQGTDISLWLRSPARGRGSRSAGSRSRVRDRSGKPAESGRPAAATRTCSG